MIDKVKALDEELKSKQFVLSEDALFAKQLDLLELRNEIESKSRSSRASSRSTSERLVAR